MLDAELEQTADEYGMRWIAETREGDRGASDWRSYGSEIEAQLAAMHELMHMHPSSGPTKTAHAYRSSPSKGAGTSHGPGKTTAGRRTSTHPGWPPSYLRR